MTDLETEGSHASNVFDLPRAEVRRRSLAGIFYLTSSSFANLIIGFFASLILARLLTPNDFGVVAIGSTAILLASALADGGLGAGMVRRPEPPSRTELRTINGIQLTLTLIVCVPAVAVALAFGRTGAVTALMVSSLPISVLGAPGRITLSRDMRYDRQLGIDFGSQLTYQLFCVVSVVLGAGVWGLAAGAVVKAVVATSLTGLLSGVFGAPSLRGWQSYGGLIRFGLSFQANWFTWVAREQLLNISIGVVAGVGSLGIWTFANRIFQLPSIAFSSLFVVGFPAMSNLLRRGEDPGPIILRTVRRAAIAGAFVFPTFAAACPQLIPSVFGSRWRDAADILPFVSLSTLILGSIAVAANSYLSASGRPGIVALASASLGVVWIGITAPLLPVIGVSAVGVGNLAGALVEALILDIATRRSAGVVPHRPLLRPLLVGSIAGVSGWLLCRYGPPGLWIALASASTTLLLVAAGLWIFCRADLKDTMGLALGTVRSAIPGLNSPSIDEA
jgi:O-antigen/teichoic acid export membrane protein